MTSKIPLAWLQLVHNKARFIIAVTGVAVAIILIFVQIGFRNSLFESTVLIHKNLNADLVIISKKSSSLIYMKDFSDDILDNLRAIDGVNFVRPIHVGTAIWENPQTYFRRSIFVLGIDPKDQSFISNEINDNVNLLGKDSTLLFDRYSRPEFGPIESLFQNDNSLEVDLNSSKNTIVGLFALGSSFATDGTLITSATNFSNLFKNRKIENIDIALLKVNTGNLDNILSEVDKRIPTDLKVMTKEQFIQFEQSYWSDNTAIGYIFGLGAITGLIVGSFIVYQTLHNDISDNLVEYATFRAIGCSDIYLLRVVCQKALIIATAGFLPGCLISLVIYQLAQKATFLPFQMTFELGLIVYGLAIISCMGSAVIASLKLREADPADIYMRVY